MEYSTITPKGLWAEQAVAINANFLKTATELYAIKSTTSKFKGYFQHLDALKLRWSSPSVGDTAWVGAVYPGILYDCAVAGKWRYTGMTPDYGDIDLTNYVKKDELLLVQVDTNKNTTFVKKMGGVIIETNEDGFHFPDATGTDVMNYTEDGLDVAKVSGHLISLILKSGVIDKQMLSSSLMSIFSTLIPVNEDGFHFPDATGTDVMNYTEQGFDVAKVSGHFVEVLNKAGVTGSLEYEVINDNVYNF